MTQINRNSDEPDDVREKRAVGFGWLAFIAVMAVLISSTFAVVYTTRTIQQLCGLIRLQADDNPPPTTERGRTLLREAKKLERKYDC